MQEFKEQLNNDIKETGFFRFILQTIMDIIKDWITYVIIISIFVITPIYIMKYDIELYNENKQLMFFILFGITLLCVLHYFGKQLCKKSFNGDKNILKRFNDMEKKFKVYDNTFNKIETNTKNFRQYYIDKIEKHEKLLEKILEKVNK